MFAKPVALNRNAHKDLLFQPARGYSFAARLNAAPLCASEFFSAAKEYAIVFVRDAAKEPFPCIVLGLQQNENCFVSLDGRWLARYLPLVVRSYPFAAVENTAAGNLQVVIDESYPGFDERTGTPLFGDKGNPGPELKRHLEFLQAYQQDAARTRRFAAELGRLDVLVECGAQLQFDGSERFGLNGFSVVDEAKLWDRPDAELGALARQGFLSLVAAHILSISNLGLLAAKVTPPGDAVTGEAPRPPTTPKAKVHAKNQN